MNELFHNCRSIKYINLSNFNTLSIKSIKYIFCNCSSLTSVDFQNLNMNNVNNTEKMFLGCSNLTYLNFKNYKERQSLDYFTIFNNTKYLSICFNKTTNPNLTYFLENNKYNLNYYNECFYHFDQNINTNSYIFENITEPIIKTSYPVIKSETINTNISISEKNSILNSYIKEINTEEYFINKTKINNYNNSLGICTCNKNCIINILLNNGCNNIYFTEDNKTGLGSLILSEILNGNIQKILKERNNIVFTNDNNLHQISHYSFQKENLNLSSLNLGECEEKIKSQANINNTEDLFIYIIEHNLEGINIPIIEYALFTENDDNIFVNLSLCENINIQIPVSINDNDIDKYNPSSEFYNDACNKHSNENGVDMTLYDRKNEFNEKNMSLCEKGCQFVNYNTSTKKVECDCLTKKNISLYIDDDSNKGDLVSKINNNDKSVSNLKVTECTNVFTSPEEIKSNTGFFLLLLILAIFLVVFIIFYVKGKSNLERQIDNIIYEQFEKNKDSNNNNKNQKNKIIKGKTKKGKNKNQKIKNSEQSKTNSLKIMNKENIGKDNTKKLNSKKLITNESVVNIKKNQNNKGQIVKNKKIPKLNDYELNNLSYNEAIN